MSWTVPAALVGERLDRVLALLADVSRSAASDLIADGEVRVNDAIEHDRARRLDLDDRIDAVVAPPAAAEPIRPDPTVEFGVRHVDDHVIVVDKPAGLVVHTGAGHDAGTLCHGLLARYPEIAQVGDPQRPGIVHRLDKGTSGLVAVARTEPAYQGLVAALAAHEVERVYHTLVWGVVDDDRGLIDAPIGRSRRDPTRMTVTPRGKPARTRYEVRHRWSEPPRTELTCWLETGRTHQIRVHLASIGHPVVADRDYRGAGLPGTDLDRPWLHAQSLRFNHPITGLDVHVVSPLPDDLAATVR
ncbi:MAG: RluA family pseudouridine synthase [Acidimicrobiia bacterium]|nr:RluA family pseudouridine synthase [Acidimicrobiia bacterium]